MSELLVNIEPRKFGEIVIVGENLKGETAKGGGPKRISNF
jgi:hypothetical protein